MENLKLFLASSGSKKLLAETLATQIREAAGRAKMSINVVPWFRDGAFPPGSDTLESLLDHCKGSSSVSPSDFFAVLLTKDDEVSKKGESSRAPRDNCILELGMFLGGLGFNPQRCFMVSSVGEKSLPSDLGGRTFIAIEEPKDLSDAVACAEAVEAAAQVIRNRIQILRRYARPEFAALTFDEILEQERPVAEGGDLCEESEVVLVTSAFRRRLSTPGEGLASNLRKGIKYRIFIPGLDNAQEAARFVASLTFPGAQPGTRVNPTSDEVRQNLLMLRDCLSIHLNPGQGSVEFVIHNAFDQDSSTCYVHCPSDDKYIALSRGRDAWQIARDLQNVSVQDDDLETPYVFRPTRHCNVAAPEIGGGLAKLRRALTARFDPALHDLVEQVCFGGNFATADTPPVRSGTP